MVTVKDTGFLYYLHCLRQVKGCGPSKIKYLIKKFCDIEEVFSANIKDLIEVPGINTTLANDILMQKEKLDESKNFIDNQIEIAKSINAKLIPIFHEDYPKNLELTGISPVIIYALGNFNFLRDQEFSKAIAIVGTREPSEYARNAAYRISQTLSNSGWVVVSGLARGIDGIAHDACLKSSGKTVAVVGSGVDIINPLSNKEIYNKIVTNGLIISEYPFGTRPNALNLKKRNKLIVGLSKYIVIIETGFKGGTMNSVKAAQEQKKILFILEPKYPPSPNSEGNSLLINEKKGIKIHPDNIIDLIIEKEQKNVQKTLF